MLHLTNRTSTAWFHHSNGCNFTDLVTITVLSRSKASSKRKISKDGIAQVSYLGDRIEPTNLERLVRLRLQNINNQKEVTKGVEQQNNRKALTTTSNSKYTQGCLWIQLGLTPANKICYIQPLSGLLTTKVNKAKCMSNMLLRRCKRCMTNYIEDDILLTYPVSMSQ